MPQVGDMKQGLTSSARPALSLIPRAAAVYTARALAYGSSKYFRANFYGPAPKGVTREARLLAYIDAAMRHLTRVSDAMNRAIGTAGDVAAAASTVDDNGGGKFPASNLPDLAHALASIAIGVSCGIDDGLLPEDPGQPWESDPMYAEVLARRGEIGLPQKDDPDPDAERRRVESLHIKMPPHHPRCSIDFRGCHPQCPKDVAERAEVVGGLAADLCPGPADLLAEDNARRNARTLDEVVHDRLYAASASKKPGRLLILARPTADTRAGTVLAEATVTSEHMAAIFGGAPLYTTTIAVARIPGEVDRFEIIDGMGNLCVSGSVGLWSSKADLRMDHTTLLIGQEVTIELRVVGRDERDVVRGCGAV